MKLHYFIFIVVVCHFCFPGNSQAIEQQLITPNRSNNPDKSHQPYVILISADGFRYDYLKKYNAPFLTQQALSGVYAADGMNPSFPSITFPNHYTLVTGLRPSHHGIVGNNMFDRKRNVYYTQRTVQEVRNPAWYNGVPIWGLAEQQQLLSACYYWPGSEAPIGGYLPTYYYHYSEKFGINDRIKGVVNWLELPEEKRPHLITFYFPEVDKAGHYFGPDHETTGAAVKYVDSSVQQLFRAVQATNIPVNFIFVADHGMLRIENEAPLKLPIKIDTSIVQVVSNGTYVSLFVKQKKNIRKIYNQIRNNTNDSFQVYLTSDVPDRYIFSKKDDRLKRIGDIVLFAQPPYYFSNNKANPGAHGYHPEDVPEMKAAFIAWGPDIQQGKVISTFDNIHVYPLLAHLLGLKIKHKIDGDDRLVKQILKTANH